MTIREAGERPATSPDPAPRTPERDGLDQSVEESFPASDVPSWAPLHVGAPGEHPAAPPARRARTRTETA